MDILRRLIIIMTVIIATGSVQGQNAMIEKFQRSYELEQSRKYTAAIDELKSIKADTYPINIRLGWLSYLAGQYAQGMAYYAKAIKLRPQSIEARLGYVLPAAKLKQWKKVGDQYDAILQIDPNNYKANYYRGLMYYNVGNYAKAWGYVSRLEQLYPFDYDAIILAGWTAFYMKNKQKANSLFIQAKLIQPGSASADEGIKKCR